MKSLAFQAKALAGLRYDGWMSRYRKGSHTVHELHYHFVSITKYRKPILRGEIALRARELIREICLAHDVRIVKGHVRPDYVHLMLSMPPQVSPSRIMQAVKGKSSHHLAREYRRLQKSFGAGTCGPEATSPVRRGM